MRQTTSHTQVLVHCRVGGLTHGGVFKFLTSLLSYWESRLLGPCVLVGVKVGMVRWESQTLKGSLINFLRRDSSVLEDTDTRGSKNPFFLPSSVSRLPTYSLTGPYNQSGIGVPPPSSPSSHPSLGTGRRLRSLSPMGPTMTPKERVPVTTGRQKCPIVRSHRDVRTILCLTTRGVGLKD